MGPSMNQIIDALCRMNPQVANNPQAQEWLNIVRSGDAKRGAEIAGNICRNQGVSEQSGYQTAAQWAQQMFSGKNQ